jgi:hypothetical protein
MSPEEREKVRSSVQRKLEGLRSSDTRTRDQSCEELNDFFESNGYRMSEERRAAFEGEIREAMGALLDLAVNEQEADVIESALHALASATVYADGAPLIDWDRLVVKLGGLKPQLAEYALSCLANTGDPKYRPIIANYLQNASEEMRANAAEQLDEIDCQINIAAGRSAFASGQSETQALEQAIVNVPRFQPSYVLCGYYVQSYDMGNRNGPAWQNYRAMLNRLGLTDPFDRSSRSRSRDRER